MVDKAIFLFPERGSICQGFGCDFIDGAKSFYDFGFSSTSLTVAVISPRYELEKYEKSIQACNCRTTLLMRRQVMHTCESYWSEPRLMSFIQGLRGKWSQYTQGEEGREDKLDSKSNYTRVYIHFGCTT